MFMLVGIWVALVFLVFWTRRVDTRLDDLIAGRRAELAEPVTPGKERRRKVSVAIDAEKFRAMMMGQPIKLENVEVRLAGLDVKDIREIIARLYDDAPKPSA
jgi:hypothetical protein